MDQDAEKSFGPKPSVEDQPSHSWTTEQLGDYAKAQHQLIVDGENQLALVYWNLGMALTIARRQFPRGEWGPRLLSLGISKPRSSRALAIFRTFSAPEHLADKSVEQA
ncbi:MAG TPA: hypothetical protein VG713_17100 [Pirellulales bacterium]|nr:hypothetical protein [Pirellulales bacterium]